MSKETTKGGAPGKDPGKAKPKRKLTREGAVEVNAATGKKKRISKRIRDADFAKRCV